MLSKSKLQEQLDQLPDEFSLDEIIERLILLDKVERAELQSKNNEVVSQSNLDEEIEKWFK